MRVPQELPGLTPKFIVDECVSIHGKIYGNGYLNSIDVLGPGASDDRVLELVKKHGCGLITYDKVLMIRTLMANHPVNFHRQGGGGMVFLKPDLEAGRKIGDPLTAYILEKDQVVIP